MATQHELEIGTPVGQRFSRLEIPNSRLTTNPRHWLAMISGPPDSGKTTFLLSCPTLYLLHVDQGPLPIDFDVSDRVWPGLDEEGNALDLDGKPFQLQWEKLLAVVDLLEKLSKENAPRPEVIGLDTLSALLDLGRDYLCRKSGKDWRDMNGLAAYDELYEMIIKLMNRLRRANYGVYITCHIVSKVVQLGDNQFSTRIPELTITDGFWKRIFWRLNYSGVICVEEREEEQQVTQASTAGVRPRVQTKKRKFTEHRLTVKDPQYLGIVKSRPRVDDVVLPPTDGWSHWEQLYTNP